MKTQIKLVWIGCLGVAAAVALFFGGQLMSPNLAVAQAPAQVTLGCRCGAYQSLRTSQVNATITHCVCGHLQCVINISRNNMQCSK